MSQIKVDAQPILLHRQSVVGTDVKNFTGGNISRNEVAILRIALLEEVAPLRLWNFTWVANVLRCSWHPHSPSLSPSALTHKTQFIGTGNRRRMNLNKFTVAIPRTMLISPANGASRADHRHRRSTEYEATPSTGKNDRIGWKRFDLHRNEILANGSSTPAAIIKNGLEEVPEFPFLYFPQSFPSANLFV